MELPQPPRPIGTQGKKPTHDFLSLCAHSSFQDQRPTPSQGGNYPTTHDFLQPLERVEIGKGKKNEKLLNERKPASVEQQILPLPGGIGTYTIRHISNFNQPSRPRPPKPEEYAPCIVEADKTSPSSSEMIKAAGGSFTLWEERESESVADASLGFNGSIGKHTIQIERHIMREAAENLGQWLKERPLQHNNNPLPPPPCSFVNGNGTSTRSSSKQASSQKNKNKNKIQSSSSSFMEIMRSAGGGKEDEEDLDDDEFLSKNSNVSSSSHQPHNNPKDGKSSGDQKANTPRSKHSATEQRRRSKINDRFQILRDIIPQNDQKRDKASFLLEVIDYIKYLQEKVNRYETSYQAWNQEPVKLTPWRNGHAPGDNMVDPSRVVNSGPGSALMFAGNFDDNNITANPTMLLSAQNPAEPDPSTSSANKVTDHHSELANKAMSIPIPLQPSTVSTFGGIGGVAQPPQRHTSDAENIAPPAQSHLWQGGLSANECPTNYTLNEHEELTIEGGTISIAGIYSQGLLNNLTQALQSSGVDLSQASISVQVDLGKRAINRLTTLPSGAKDHEDPTSNQTTIHPHVQINGEDSNGPRKRLRRE